MLPPQFIVTEFTELYENIIASEIHSRVRHHQTVVQLLASQLESYQILFFRQDRNPDHHMRVPTEHRGLIVRKVTI
jgi:hypothetical protein